MKQLLLLTIFSLMLFASTDAETLYLKNACNSCHGIYAEGMGASPRLQGLREDLLLATKIKRSSTRQDTYSIRNSDDFFCQSTR